MTPPAFAGVRAPRVDERRVAPPRPTPPGPASSPASWTTRGKEHPTARLLDLVPGRSGTVYKNWLAERGKDFRAGVRIATLDPLPGTARTPSPWPAPRTQPACAAPFTSSHSPVMPQVRYAAASSKTRPNTADAQAIPSCHIRLLLRASHTQAPPANKNDSVRPSRQIRRISVSKSPTTAPSKSETSSTKPHPPTADTWPHTS